MCLPGCFGLPRALSASPNNESWPLQTGRFCLPDSSWSQAGVGIGAICVQRTEGEICPTSGSGCSSLKNGLCQLFQPLLIPGSPSQCKGPSRIAPWGFSLSHSAWSSHVLRAGTLPGNNSAEQFPAALRSPHMDPPDTSFCPLGEALGRAMCTARPLCCPSPT